MVTTAVDETPLSVSPVERRNSLEKHLLNRPDAQDLKERHILLDTNVAPSLQAARQELARQRTTDSLKKHLEQRPDRDALVERMLSSFISLRCVYICYMPGERYRWM
jgi:hypothetical protein